MIISLITIYVLIGCITGYLGAKDSLAGWTRYPESYVNRADDAADETILVFIIYSFLWPMALPRYGYKKLIRPRWAGKIRQKMKENSKK